MIDKSQFRTLRTGSETEGIPSVSRVMRQSYPFNMAALSGDQQILPRHKLLLSGRKPQASYLT